MKKIIPILLALLIMAGVATTIVILDNDDKKETKEENKDNKKEDNETVEKKEDEPQEIVEEYEDYTFKNIKTYDKSTNGQIVYNSEKKYYSEDNIKINDNLKINLKSGKLYLKDLNNNEVQLTELSGIMDMMSCVYLDDGRYILTLLMEDGSSYVGTYHGSEIGNELESAKSSIEETIIKANTTLKLTKIGYEKNYVSGMYRNIVYALTENDSLISIDAYGAVKELKNVYMQYAKISPNTIFNIDFDASVYLNDGEYLKDENGDNLYIQNISLIAKSYTEGSIYMLDRQGYLYVYEITESGNELKKYSDQKVTKIGSMNNDNNYAYMFEDNTVLEVTGLVQM